MFSSNYKLLFQKTFKQIARLGFYFLHKNINFKNQDSVIIIIYGKVKTFFWVHIAVGLPVLIDKKAVAFAKKDN